MQVTITNEFEGGQFSAQTSSYTITGDFRKNPTLGKVTYITGSVNSAGGDYIGNVNAYWSEDALKYNLNDIAIENLAGVAAAVVELVGELEGTNE